MTTPATQHKTASALRLRDRLSGRIVAMSVAVGLLVVVAASAVAWDGGVAGWEASTLRWVNDWPDWFEPPMWALQQVGVFMAPVIGGLVIVWFTRQWRFLVPFVLVLPLKLGIEKAVVKQLVERERPFVSLGSDINVRGPAFEGLSFPSGHSTTAFALAILLIAFVAPRWRPVPLGWAVIVAIARLCYGEHNVLDVIAGAALGTAFGMTLWYVFLNPHVPVAADDLS